MRFALARGLVVERALIIRRVEGYELPFAGIPVQDKFSFTFANDYPRCDTPPSRLSRRSCRAARSVNACKTLAGLKTTRSATPFIAAPRFELPLLGSPAQRKQAPRSGRGNRKGRRQPPSGP